MCGKWEMCVFCTYSSYPDTHNVSPPEGGVSCMRRKLKSAGHSSKRPIEKIGCLVRFFGWVVFFDIGQVDGTERREKGKRGDRNVMEADTRRDRVCSWFRPQV